MPKGNEGGRKEKQRRKPRQPKTNVWETEADQAKESGGNERTVEGAQEENTEGKKESLGKEERAQHGRRKNKRG